MTSEVRGGGKWVAQGEGMWLGRLAICGSPARCWNEAGMAKNVLRRRLAEEGDCVEVLDASVVMVVVVRVVVVVVVRLAYKGLTGPGN